MPLSLVKTGRAVLVRKIGGKEETRKHLGSMGFVAGNTVTVVAELGGSLIVSVKNSRVAISRELADKIFVA
ncbi:MAG: ferrous iron transport protein A [Spirochaetales bacterium]|jgi:ferrous iron transport protein A|nr:ferrous iron transport protein A [Spirochaetales bacterium]